METRNAGNGHGWGQLDLGQARHAPQRAAHSCWQCTVFELATIQTEPWKTGMCIWNAMSSYEISLSHLGWCSAVASRHGREVQAQGSCSSTVFTAVVRQARTKEEAAPAQNPTADSHAHGLCEERDKLPKSAMLRSTRQGGRAGQHTRSGPSPASTSTPSRAECSDLPSALHFHVRGKPAARL